VGFKTAGGMDFSPLTGGPTGGADFYRQIGESIVNSALKNLTELAVQEGGAPKDGNIASQVKELAETAKTLSGLYRDQEESVLKRLKEEREARERAEKQAAELRQSMGKENVTVFQLIMEALGKSEERFYRLMEKMDERFERLVEKLEKKGGGNGDDFLTDLGRKVVEGSLNRDPMEEFNRVTQVIQAATGLAKTVSPQVSLDDQIRLMMTKEEIEMKKRKAEAEEERANKHAQILERAVEVLPAVAQVWQRPQAQDQDGHNGRKQVPLRRFACSNCGSEVLLPTNVAPKACAACGAPVGQQRPAGEAE